METQYKVVVEQQPAAAEMAVVIKGLTAYNASQTAGDTPNYLFVALRDQDGEVVGGVVGATYLGWLQVQAVWVADTVRGGGYGTALMQAAEAEAVRRNCPRVFLETLSFQALPFYEKCGYKVVSQVADFPPGAGSRYALTKELPPA